MNKLVIAIDPGKGGGIAHQCKGKVSAVDMPPNARSLNDYLAFLVETYGRPIVFIEKVQAFQDDKNAGGKSFMINKMLANYEQILTILRLARIPFVQTFPVSWQSGCGLKKGFPRDEPKASRKKRYKEFAQSRFPELKPNLKTADALCILHFGLYKIAEDVNWVIDRVENTDPSLTGNQLF